MAAWSLPARAADTSAYDFTFEAIEGGPMPLAQWRGKAIMVVNTASLCGYTPQYSGLQAMWEKYRDRGLVVVAVPSNDFGGQEPGKATEIKTFCETTFGIDFPMTAKVDVVGPNAHPFYVWAAEVLGPGRVPRWNFHKYLVGTDGQLMTSFGSTIEPKDPRIVEAVEAALPKA